MQNEIKVEKLVLVSLYSHFPTVTKLFHLKHLDVGESSSPARKQQQKLPIKCHPLSRGNRSWYTVHSLRKKMVAPHRDTNNGRDPSESRGGSGGGGDLDYILESVVGGGGWWQWRNTLLFLPLYYVSGYPLFLTIYAAYTPPHRCVAKSAFCCVYTCTFFICLRSKGASLINVMARMPRWMSPTWNWQCQKVLILFCHKLF